MNSISNSNLYEASLLLLLCIIYHLTSTSVNAGGKGKVPVYMPIPIPVPMPVGGPKPFNHHHQQQQINHNQKNDDDEGEIKKIYLLQPMPPPKVQQHHHHQGGPNIEQHHHHHHQQQQQPAPQTKTHSEMKVLPIVVIPPIAPMPPIQIPTISQSHAPRMTLSPQFNNYLLSGSESIETNKRRLHSHHYDHHQDQKSFSDYGGSGGGALYRRERPRLRNRQAMMSRNNGYYIQPRARVRIQEDFGGDDYDYNPTSWRSMASRSISVSPSSNGRSSSSSYRRRSPREYESLGGRSRQQLSATRDSIRDIINNAPSLFDDEPPLDLGSESTRVDLLPNNNNRERAYSATSRQNYNQDTGDYASDLMNSEQRGDTGSNDYIDEGSSSRGGGGGYDRASSASNLASSTELARQQYNRHTPQLAKPETQQSNSVYYDRDYQASPDEPSRLSIRYTSSGGGGPTTTTKRLFVDDREVLEEDDMWRFDSIKSVATHVNPNVNTTTNNTSDIIVKQNTNSIKKPTSSTTTLPPMSIKNSKKN